MRLKRVVFYRARARIFTYTRTHAVHSAGGSSAARPSPAVKCFLHVNGSRIDVIQINLLVSAAPPSLAGRTFAALDSDFKWPLVYIFPRALDRVSSRELHNPVAAKALGIFVNLPVQSVDRSV